MKRLIRNIKKSPIPQNRPLSTTPSILSPFTPPYTHSLSPPPIAPSNLRPPYQHSLGYKGPNRINPPYRFSLDPSTEKSVGSTKVDVWVDWAKGMIGTTEGRGDVERVWKDTLGGLGNAKLDDVRVPEVVYTSLTDYLSDISAIETIKSRGSLIVRDVIPDSVALGWAKEITTAEEIRSGDIIYWHSALLAARSNSSVVNTTSSLLSALTGSGDEGYILAQSLSRGFGSRSDKWGIEDIDDPWAINTQAGPSTPLVAQISLTPTSINLPTTIHTATYNLIRPLFRPIRTRLSRSSLESYLHSSNWRLIDLSEIIHSSSLGERDMPHLAGMEWIRSTINPGDVILRHQLAPTSQNQDKDQMFLPVTLLPRTEENKAYIQNQRRSFELGFPPPSEVGIWGDRGAVRVEETFPGRLEGQARRMMGY